MLAHNGFHADDSMLYDYAGEALRMLEDDAGQCTASPEACATCPNSGDCVNALTCVDIDESAITCTPGAMCETCPDNITCPEAPTTARDVIDPDGVFDDWDDDSDD